MASFAALPAILFKWISIRVVIIVIMRLLRSNFTYMLMIKNMGRNPPNTKWGFSECLTKQDKV